MAVLPLGVLFASGLSATPKRAEPPKAGADAKAVAITFAADRPTDAGVAVGDAIACAVGAAAFRDRAYHNECIAKVTASRAHLAADLAAMGFRVWPSQANFLLVRPPAAGVGAEAVYEALKRRGILIRYFKEPPLDDKLRISIGTDDDNAALVRAIGETLGCPPPA